MHVRVGIVQPGSAAMTSQPVKVPADMPLLAPSPIGSASPGKAESTGTLQAAALEYYLAPMDTHIPSGTAVPVDCGE